MFLELFGGAGKFGAFVRSYRQGVLDYPEDFNPETGLFRKKAVTRPGRVAPGRKSGSTGDRRESAHVRHRPTDEVLDQVLKLTGATMADLKRVEMGPRANPERRFAIWALSRSSALNQREVGKVLNVSYDQVTRLLGRLRKHGAKDPVAGWMKDWREQEAGYVSSAGV